MEIYDAMSALREKALMDRTFRQKLLDTYRSETPLSDFCRLSTEAGIPLYEMDLLSAGEDYYAAMRRSTNGGGENSPLLTGEDDYYELFIEELKENPGKNPGNGRNIGIHEGARYALYGSDAEGYGYLF